MKEHIRIIKRKMHDIDLMIEFLEDKELSKECLDPVRQHVEIYFSSAYDIVETMKKIVNEYGSVQLNEAWKYTNK